MSSQLAIVNGACKLRFNLSTNERKRASSFSAFKLNNFFNLNE